MRARRRMRPSSRPSLTRASPRRFSRPGRRRRCPSRMAVPFSCRTGRPTHGSIRFGAEVELKSNHDRARIEIDGALPRPERTSIHSEQERIARAAMIHPLTELEASHLQAAETAPVLRDTGCHRSRAQGLARSIRRPHPAGRPADRRGSEVEPSPTYAGPTSSYMLRYQSAMITTHRRLLT